MRLDEIRRELTERGLAHSELLLSYLKIFLIGATRLKRQQQGIESTSPLRLPEVLTNLKRLVEQHFRAHHAPADYAAMLRMAPRSLARLVNMHMNKTLTGLIRERLVRQAKWELLHTRKARQGRRADSMSSSSDLP